MVPITLVTASTSSLPPDVIAAHNIHLVPFVIQFLDGNYKEGNDLNLEDFYRRLGSVEAVPTTAPTSVAQFIQYFEHQHPDAETIMVFHIAARMSKSYANGVQAAARVPGRRIINIDTGSFSMGAGLQIIEVAKALQQGATLDTVSRLIPELAQRALALFVPHSIQHLRLSGRVGRVPAMAASLLGIHPVLGLGNQGMEVVARPRSIEAAYETMLRQVQAFVGKCGASALAITHTHAVATAATFKQMVGAKFPDVPIYSSEAGPILAVHCGPNAVGLAVLREP